MICLQSEDAFNPVVLTTTMKTLTQLAESVQIEATKGARKTTFKPGDWRREKQGWRITLKYQGRQYSLDFWQGHHADAPDAKNILSCILSDCSYTEYSVDEFQRELGYDNRKEAEAIYNHCSKQRREVERLLGDDFDTFMEAENDV